MSPFDRVAAVVPALNEEGNIGAVVAGLRLAGVDRIVVVDNGSIDKTASEAAAAGAKVVHEHRMGYGQACQTGSEAALDDGAEFLVYIDGDQSSRPGEIDDLVQPLLDDTADLVLGSRVLGTRERGAMGAHQRFGNSLTAALMRRLYAIDVTDLGPYRAIRGDLLVALNMREMTFGWPTEMMVKSAKRGSRIVEVPVSWDRRGAGESKVSGTLKGSMLAGYHILGVTLRNARG